MPAHVAEATFFLGSAFRAFAAFGFRVVAGVIRVVGNVGGFSSLRGFRVVGWAGGIAAGFRVFLESGAHAAVGDEDDFIAAFGQGAADEIVALTDIDGDDAVLPDVAELAEIAAFHHAETGGKNNKFVRVPGGVLVGFALRGNAEHGGDFFLGTEVEQVLDAAALRSAGAFGNLIDALRIDAAAVGEEHQPVVGGGREKVFHKVAHLLFVRAAELGGFHASQSLAAAALAAVFAAQGAFDIAAVGNGDDHAFVGDQVHQIDLALLGGEVGQTRGGVLGFDDLQFLLDDRQHAGFAGDDVHEVGDFRHDVVVFRFDFIPLQAGQFIQLKLHDGFDLAVGELIAVAHDVGWPRMITPTDCAASTVKG